MGNNTLIEMEREQELSILFHMPLEWLSESVYHMTVAKASV